MRGCAGRPNLPAWITVSAKSTRPHRAYPQHHPLDRMDPTLHEQRLIALLDRIAARAGEAGRHADSERALRELYDITSSRLYGTALRVVSNREWAEDVLQEAYLNIWRI